MTTDQLKAWQGEFGRDYAYRNAREAWKIDNLVTGFTRMLAGIEIDSVLEVGCNIGLNLLALRRFYGDRVKLYGVEPNDEARSILKSFGDLDLADLWANSAFDLPLPDGGVDLAFTMGVLIHIHPDDLGRAVDELVRVARRYVLCVEYFSHQPVEIPYRGRPGLLFKRDFGGFYLDRHPGLKPLGYGFLWQREFRNMDNLNWWLFEKQS